MVRIHADQLQAGTKCNSDAREPVNCIVSGPLAHILRISRVFGLAPLNFVSREHGYTITLSKSMRLYGYILLTVLVAWSLLDLGIRFAGREKPSEYVLTNIPELIFSSKVFMSFISISIGVCGASKRMKNLFRLIESISSVDKNLARQSSEKMDRKICTILFVILFMYLTTMVCAFSVWVLESRTLHILSWTVLSKYTKFLVINYVMIVLELQFAVTALFVQARFRAANNIIVVFTNNALDGSPIVTSSRESVYRLVTSYGTLCDGVQLVNKSYGLPLIIIIVTILADLVVSLYLIIDRIISSSTQAKYSVLYGIIWCINNIVRVLNIVEPCHYTVKEAEKTRRLVCRLITVTPPTGLLAERLELFSKQLIMRRVSYSPLSMFTLYRTLLTAAIGTITTYLVILAQFNKHN